MVGGGGGGGGDGGDCESQRIGFRDVIYKDVLIVIDFEVCWFSRIVYVQIRILNTLVQTNNLIFLIEIT